MFVNAFDDVLTECRKFPGPIREIGQNFVRHALGSKRPTANRHPISTLTEVPVARAAGRGNSFLDFSVSHVTMRASMNPRIGRAQLRFLLALGCATLVLVGASRRSPAYALNGHRWTAGSQIEMHLQLTRPAVPLQDGSASWDASAADALAIWNQYLDTVQFVQGARGATYGGDKKNSAFFSNTIYGEGFPPGVLAVTLNFSDSDEFTETDVIFNNNVTWNSYRGPRQGVFDFHRVALHEFGHVLGLDHPDHYGQSVTAIMNSTISDLDQLAADDIAGARFLYGIRITSSLSSLTVQAGDSFNYQITANNTPQSYEASGLPPGLSLDSSSGLISGTPTLAGTYMVAIVAHGTPKDASGTLRITVIGARITSNLRPPSVHAGDPFSYQITATNNPFAFDAVGLPAGLSLDRASGLISGTPTAAGTFMVTLTAHTALGDGSGTLYITVIPFDITSSLSSAASLGGDFRYQITANNNPSSYSAVGLPAGLQLDSATGLITGTATLSGNHQFTVIAHGAKGDAVGIVHISVAAPLPLQPKPAGALKTFDISVKRFAFDPIRSRLYASDQINSAIIVIDAVSLSPVRIIKLAHVPYGISISADNSKLWIACSKPNDYSNGWVGALDLNNLEVLPSLRVQAPLFHVVEGPSGRLYASGQSQIFEVDQNNGALLGTIYPGNGFLAASPDRRTLFAGGNGSPSTVWAFDISQVASSLREQTDFNTRGGGCLDLKVSHDGRYLCMPAQQGNSRVFGMTSTALMSAADVRVVLGNFINNSSNIANRVGPVAFSNDDNVVYQAAAADSNDGTGTSRLEIFDVASFSQTGLIDLGRTQFYGSPVVNDLVVDSSGAYIFVATEVHGYAGQLRVYSTGRGVPPTVVPPRSVLNVSTRLRIGAGENAGIGGFIIQGNAPKTVMVRAIGPSLSKFGVAGALADPALELYDAAGDLVAQNDNWNSRRMDVLFSGLAPSDERDSALLFTLQPGAYTAVVRGATAGSGVALVEVYDLNAQGGSQLANISTRGKVEGGDNVMIGGFILGGDQTTTVVVRAIGPSLTNFGVGEVLSDPMLEVHDGDGALLAQDDDWRMYQEQQLIDSGLAPTDDREAAMLLSLQPGAYTAIVRGKDNNIGVGLVEVYNLDAN